VQVSRTAPISAIPARSPSRDSKSYDWASRMHKPACRINGTRTFSTPIASAKAERFGDRPERRRVSLTAFSRTGRTAPGHGAARGFSSGLNRGFPPWLEAGSFLHTGLNSWAHATKQPQRPGTEACSPAPPSPGPARLSVSDTRADLAEKADIAMYEDDDERMEAAEQLARLDLRAGAEAFRAIAGDEGADNEQRIDAAEQLTRLDRRAAAEAFRAIACDESVDDGLRVEAAERIPRLDRRAAAEAFRVIACDESVDDGLRSSAAEQLPGLDPRAAAEAFRLIVSDPIMDDGLRASAAEQLARLNPEPLGRQ